MMKIDFDYYDKRQQTKNKINKKYKNQVDNYEKLFAVPEQKDFKKLEDYQKANDKYIETFKDFMKILKETRRLCIAVLRYKNYISYMPKHKILGIYEDDNYPDYVILESL